jgi:hypothetical protein
MFTFSKNISVTNTIKQNNIPMIAHNENYEQLEQYQSNYKDTLKI